MFLLLHPYLETLLIEVREEALGAAKVAEDDYVLIRRHCRWQEPRRNEDRSQG